MRGNTKNVDLAQKAMDVQFGLKSQNEMIDKLDKYFNDEFYEYKNKYSIFDFHNKKENIFIELKSRRNSSKVYPTQLIGWNKYDRAIKKVKEGKQVYFIWKLTDKTLIYKVNLKDTFETKMLGNFQRNDKADELVIIPNELCLEMGEGVPMWWD